METYKYKISYKEEIFLTVKNAFTHWANLEATRDDEEIHLFAKLKKLSHFTMVLIFLLLNRSHYETMK